MFVQEYTAVFLHFLNASNKMPYALDNLLLGLKAFCLVLAHSIGEGVPRFLAFAELGVLCHVAYAYGILLVLTHSVREGVAFYFDVLLYSFY